MKSTIAPLFVCSLPRSGSTLLQRMIAAHSRVSTAAEPWLLLPFVYALRQDGSCTEYSHFTARNALSQFIANMPGGREAYYGQLRSLAEKLYGRYSNPGDKYFLDKTPRYHLIIDDIMEIFPDAKFIFLWRNPLSVVASALHTFGRGKWRLHHYSIDFYKGFERLHAAYMKHRDRVLGVNYESLLTNPDSETRRLFSYLGLEDDMPALGSFSKIQFAGTLGDPTGTKAYDQVSTQPLCKWQNSLCNPIRRAWVRRYLEWIRADRLGDIGYNYQSLVDDLDGLNMTSKFLLSDSLRIGYGFLSTIFEAEVLRQKIGAVRSGTRVYLYR